MKIIEDFNKMMETSAKSVDFPHRDEINSPESNIFEKSNEFGSISTCSRKSFIDVLVHDRPAPLIGNAAKVVELQSDILALGRRGHTGVQRGANQGRDCHRHLSFHGVTTDGHVVLSLELEVLGPSPWNRAENDSGSPAGA
jgi:hypothetical protein